jgi:hypothetical protein
MALDISQLSIYHVTVMVFVYYGKSTMLVDI